MEKEITIYDIARHLDLSAATVSRGLKNHPSINKNTRKKIQETARLLGYRFNSFASNLRSQKTQTIGVVVPRLNSYFMSAVLAGMEDAASRENYNLIISQSLESAEKERANANTMFNKRVDGLLVSLAYDTTDIDHFQPFFQKQIPVVFFDRVYEHPASLCVVIDNFQAAYELTTHLISQGCRRIMHLGGDLRRNVYADRLRGYKQALLDHKIRFNENLVILGRLNEASGKEAAQQILQLGNKRPDAVFSANDTAASFCMLSLKEAGLAIPRDVAFAGFNNDPVSKIVDPQLTTVDYSGYEMGEVAVNSLINHFQGEQDIRATHRIVLRSTLIIRASSLKNKTL